MSVGTVTNRLVSAVCIGAAVALLVLVQSAGAAATTSAEIKTTATATASAESITTATASAESITTATATTQAANGSTSAPMSLVTDSIVITTETQSQVSDLLEAMPGGAAGMALTDILGTSGTQTLSPETTTETAPPTTIGAPGAGVQKPVYMLPHEPMRIFDAGRGEGLSALQQAVQRMREQELQRRQPAKSRITDIATYRYVLAGDTETAAIREAEARALMSASARIYFDDNKIIIGRELLEPYLRRSGNKAVAEVKIDGQPYLLANKKIQMPVRVSVNLPLLFEDLAEKQFVSQPNIRPCMTIHLGEYVGDAQTSSPLTVPRLSAAMENNLFRVQSREMERPPLNVDLSTSAGQLMTARLEAQRNGIDVILTGSMRTMPITTGQILYDTYHFWQTSLDLYLYRVDTGELIAQLHDSYSANAPSDSQAIGNTLDTIVQRTGASLATTLHDMWPNTMLGQANYRVMVSGVDAAALDRIQTLLAAVAPGQVRIFRKAHYGDVAVLNLVLPEGKHIDLESFLRRSTNPQFIVRRVDEHRFEIEPI